MLRTGAELNYLQGRTNLPTNKSSAEIVRDIPPAERARSFFSARVAEAHVVDRFRQITDDYNTGKIGRDEARNLMMTYARQNGLDDGTEALKNIASTARLNLIIDQNAKQARAVGQYDRMYAPANLEAFPYVIYHASVGSKEPRASHMRYDGMIFDKNDPWLRSHWPPWEFGCNCELENCSAKRAGKSPELIRPLSQPEVAGKVYAESGYKFDPKHAFEEYDLSGVSSPQSRGDIREAAEMELGSQVTFSGTPADEKFSASFEPKEFRTFEEEKLPPSSDWKEHELPAPPERINPVAAREELTAGKKVASPTGDEVIFDNDCLNHWQVEEAKPKNEIDARLSNLLMAVETVANPLEIWDQGSQLGFIKAFQKSTGGFTGCLVFVLKDKKVRTYFVKDINALNKARKGFSVQRFDAKSKNGAD